MEHLFEIRRVLGQMDKLGPGYRKIDDLLRAAVDKLGMQVTDPAAVDAKEYMRYEMICMAQNKKPQSVVAWFKNRSK
jgi:hypothetical protein